MPKRGGGWEVELARKEGGGGEEKFSNQEGSYWKNIGIGRGLSYFNHYLQHIILKPIQLSDINAKLAHK